MPIYSRTGQITGINMADQLLVLCTLILIEFYQRPITVNSSLIVVFAYFLIGQKFIHYYPF